jgi:hypothetical protein
MKRLIVFVLFTMLSFMSWGQCAMCRTQVENNVSDGGLSMAEGLNTGILYLFVTPYIALAVVAFFWFRHSKFNNGKISLNKRY